MQIDDRLVDLAPSMAVTIEIKTGSRRIIDYLLSPFLRYSQESLRERWAAMAFGSGLPDQSGQS